MGHLFTRIRRDVMVGITCLPVSLGLGQKNFLRSPGQSRLGRPLRTLPCRQRAPKIQPSQTERWWASAQWINWATKRLVRNLSLVQAAQSDISSNRFGFLTHHSIDSAMASPVTVGRIKPLSSCVMTSPQFLEAMTGRLEARASSCVSPNPSE